MSDFKNSHLEKVLKSHNIENNEALMTAYRSKRDEVREDLKVKFGTVIFRLIHSGSYKKRTAVNIKFDMDLVIPFKKEDADSLETIFKELARYFDIDYRKKDSSLLQVKKQKVAIGLTFLVDGHMLDLDIVPGREIDDYEKDGNLNLYVNETMGTIGKSTYLKTNIQKQIDNIRNNSSTREIIKLLKVWKRRKSGQIKSFVIELITVKALSDYTGEEELWEKLKHTLAYIRDNIKTARLVDPGNSNNVVSDSLNGFEKTAISDTMKWMLDDIDGTESHIEHHFQINPDYPQEDAGQKQHSAAPYVIGSSRKPEKLNDEDFG